MSATLSLSDASKQRRNARLLAFVLLYTILGGALRKWGGLSGLYSNALLMGQILMPWVFYLFAAGRRGKHLPVLLLSGALLLLMAFNPMNQSLYHGMFGVLLHAGFWLIGFHYVENRDLYPWNRLQGLLLFIFFLEIGLGLLQYSLPRSHVLNRYAAESATSIAFVGEAARVTGTFSFVSGFSCWLFLVNLWVWGLAVQRSKLLLINTLIGLSVLASLISGARLTLVFTLLFALFAYMHLVRHLAFSKILPALFFIGGSLVVAYENSSFVQQAWTNFYSRIEDGFRDKEYGRRTFGVVDEVLNYKGDYALLGTGLGGTYQGARLIWGESYFLQQYGGYEEEPERIILEGGFVLFALRAGLLLYFLAELHIPRGYKLLFFIVILFFSQNIFNAYNIIFTALGLSFLDWSYGRSPERFAAPTSAVERSHIGQVYTEKQNQHSTSPRS